MPIQATNSKRVIPILIKPSEGYPAKWRVGIKNVPTRMVSVESTKSAESGYESDKNVTASSTQVFKSKLIKGSAKPKEKRDSGVQLPVSTLIRAPGSEIPLLSIRGKLPVSTLIPEPGSKIPILSRVKVQAFNIPKSKSGIAASKVAASKVAALGLLVEKMEDFKTKVRDSLPNKDMFVNESDYRLVINNKSKALQAAYGALEKARRGDLIGAQAAAKKASGFYQQAELTERIELVERMEDLKIKAEHSFSNENKFVKPLIESADKALKKALSGDLKGAKAHAIEAIRAESLQKIESGLGKEEEFMDEVKQNVLAELAVLGKNDREAVSHSVSKIKSLFGDIQQTRQEIGKALRSKNIVAAQQHLKAFKGHTKKFSKYLEEITCHNNTAKLARKKALGERKVTFAPNVELYQAGE